MTYKGKEITEEEITLDVIKEVVGEYLPHLLRQKTWGFPYIKRFNNDSNILSPELVLKDFIKYLHSKRRKREIKDIKECINERLKENKYFFRSREYVFFIDSIKNGIKAAKKLKTEKRIEDAPDGYELYKDQLTDPRWSAFRNFVFTVKKRRCEKCGSKEGLQIHHPKYIAGRKAWEYTCDEVQVLCRKCHQEEHGIK